MTLARTLLQITLAATASVNIATASVDLSDYNLIFSDEFNSQSLDNSKWKTQLLWGSFTPINGEEQYYVNTLGIDAAHTYHPFQFTGSSLIITADEVDATHQATEQPAENDPHWSQNPDENYNPSYQAEDQGYLSGVIASYDSFNFTHGYVEARAKLPVGQGLWSAFWLLNSKYVEDNPEIDIVEALGQFDNEVYHTAHYADTSNGWNVVSTPTYETEIDNYSVDFHTYGVLWEPTKITWFVDGVAVKTIDDNDFLIAKQSMYIIANLAVGGSWPGAPDSTTVFPAQYELDYIRAYQRKPKDTITPEVLASDYQLMFFDEFNGTSLDASKWNTSYLWGPFFPINQEKQYYVDTLGRDDGFSVDPFFVNNGTLTITAAPIAASELPEQPALSDPSWQAFPTHQYNPSYQSTAELTPDYTSGLITSYDNFKFVNGYVEARIKIPEGGGLWPAFWLLNGYYVGPQPEIDIMEAQGEAANIVHHSYHYNDNNGNLLSSAETTSLPTGLYSDDFHTYGLQWDRGHLTWYIDGVKVRELIGPEVSTQLMYVLLNLAVGGNFVGEIDTTALPASLEIDYVRAYQRNNKNNFVLPDDTEAPEVFFDSSLSDNSIISADQSFHGNATDTGSAGISQVNVFFRNLSTGEFVDMNGASLEAWEAFPATLTDNTGSQANWNFDHLLPAGKYRVHAYAIDSVGNFNKWQSSIRVTIQPETDEMAPVTVIGYPTETMNVLLASEPISGTATDVGTAGISEVRVFIRDLSSGQFMSLNGDTLDGWDDSPATIEPIGPDWASVNWSIEHSLPAGNYKIHGYAIDAQNNKNKWQTSVRANVINDTDSVAPVATFSEQLTQSATIEINGSITGSITDEGGSGLSSAFVFVRDISTGEFVDLSGNALDQWEAYPALLSNQTVDSANWQIAPSLPVGGYKIFVYAIDNAGNKNKWGSSLKINVVAGVSPDMDAPQTVFDETLSEGSTIDSNTVISGTTLDPSGSTISSVKVFVRDLSTGLFIGLDGTGDGSFQEAHAQFASNGDGQISWFVEQTLPEGQYRFFAYATDEFGNKNKWGNSIKLNMLD